MINRTLLKSFLAAAVAGGIAAPLCLAQATSGNTIIEPNGLLSEDFTGGGSNSVAGTASGLTGVQSKFWSGDFVFTFTPGAKSTNFHPEAGFDYGNGELASGQTHTGGTMTYQVFATWPASTNVSGGGTVFSVTNDGTTLETSPIDQNTGGSGNPGGVNAWLLLGTVDMTFGQTYTVTSSPVSATFVGQRMAGVMYAPIPEPSTYAAIFGGLALLGAFVYRRRLSVKK